MYVFIKNTFVTASGPRDFLKTIDVLGGLLPKNVGRALRPCFT